MKDKTIILIGHSGAGKTTLTHNLQHELTKMLKEDDTVLIKGSSDVQGEEMIDFKTTKFDESIPIKNYFQPLDRQYIPSLKELNKPFYLDILKKSKRTKTKKK